MNIVCYRYAPGGFAGDLDALNRDILLRLQESGRFLPSQAVLDGRFAIRVANTNHRASREIFDALVTTTLEIGREVAAGR